MSIVRNISKHIPNTITCLNLFSGCTAVLLAIEGYLEIAAILIFMASVFDFMDGLVARLANAYSPMGKELDSLADMVSFGLAPGLIAMGYLKKAILGDVSNDFNPLELNISQITLLLSAFVIPVFSALRLAKFNIDTRQTSSFIGVPTPANAMFWASLPLVTYLGDYPILEKWTSTPVILLVAIIITSLLLVVEIPMFALKIKNVSWKDNKVRYLFLICLAILAILIQWLVVPLILFVYILFSLIENLTKRNKDRK